MLRLVGWAVRLPPFHDPGAAVWEQRRPGEHACQLMRMLLGADPASPAAAAGQQALTEGLLRTQAPHAAARQLAAATEGLQRGPQPPSETCRGQAVECLEAHQVITKAVMDFAARPRDPGLFGRFLAAALAQSAVLEHAARLLLVILPSSAQAPGEGLVGFELATASSQFAASYLSCSVLLKTTSDSDATAAAGQLRRVLSGPCARHAALVLGLAALGELEGRPVGEEAPCPCLGQVPHLLHLEADLTAVDAVPRLFALTTALRPCLPRATGPMTAARVLLRTGFLVAAGTDPNSGAHVAAGPSVGRGGPVLVAQRLVLLPEDKARIMASVFPQLVSSVMSLRPWLGPRAAVAADVWRLAAALARSEALREGANEGQRDLVLKPTSFLLQACKNGVGATGYEGGSWRFPTEPPPEVAAALAGGALPFLERLLRRAGTAPEGLEGVTLAYLGSGELDCALPLLAYGEPRQAAAFVATVTKLLRRTKARVLLGVQVHGDGIGLALASDLANSVSALLRSTPAASPPLGRLALVLSLALPEWLPELSRLQLQEQPRGRQEQQQRERRRGERRAQQQREEVEVQCYSGRELYHSMGALLAGLSMSTLPPAGAASLLSPAGPFAAPTPAPATAAASSGGSGAGGGGGGGWREGALSEPELVEVVGAALGLLQRRRPDPKAWGQLYVQAAALALRLADAHPAEVRGAIDGASSATAWRPGAVRGVAEVLRGLEGLASLTAATERLAKQLEAWARGGGARFSAPGAWLEGFGRGTLGAALAGLLVPPAEARRRLGLPACSNPACANLAGDSEAGLWLRKCGGCGQVSYCCRECQTAHWRSGHKQSCGGGAFAG
ncbi:hypothetical protein HYH03_001251 [Edaphochlamys debaryana]|uniref:phytol kinase n=1 Tax=Edaphochlamys debaryana TaxID=47281 RepID=A0A835YGQ5_9CHLO|nr:hypothetical protein HYH03_001251 [Edaphochlamys debaryana]|eukprot:KAG2501472.1 hypothetical protein HYH03_001251 [Edaphochlamys debaryana]